MLKKFDKAIGKVLASVYGMWFLNFTVAQTLRRAAYYLMGCNALKHGREGISVDDVVVGYLTAFKVVLYDIRPVVRSLYDEDNWVDVERHPYTDAQWGTITFNEQLYDAALGEYQNIYRVIEENESPWDLPDNIHLTTYYYCMVGAEDSDTGPFEEPQEFDVTGSDDSVNVVIDNRYEETQLTIIKMDK